MDFRQLRYFVAAVEARSMTGAARACAAGQPTLSTQIKRLELELGAPLFVRTGGGLEPTSAGCALYREAAPMLRSAAHGLHYLKSGAHRPINTIALRIDCSVGSLLGRAVQTAVRAAQARNPHLNVLLEGAECAGPRGSLSRGAPSDDGAAPASGTWHIRHTLARARRRGLADACDIWLLVAAGSGRKGPPPSRRVSEGGVVHVPAVPDDVATALAERPGILAGATLRMQGGDATDLLRMLLSQNRGIALLPRLAVSEALLRDPRLAIEKISAGLPRLAVAIDGGRLAPALRRALIASLRRAAGRARKEPDRARTLDELPDARQLQYFLAACDEGGMTRTAARFNIVQPALSAQMKSFERRLGRKLFERLPHGIAPTASGRAAYAVYAPIVAQLAALRRKEPPRRSNGAIFHLGVLPALDEQSLLLQAVTAAIREWQETFPKVTLKSSEALSDSLLDWVTDGTIDLAIVDDLQGRTAFASSSLSQEPLAVLTSAASTNCPSGPIKLVDVARLDLVLPSARHGLRALMNRQFASIGISLAPKLELDSMASAVSLVKSGGWATILPASAVQRSIDDRQLAAHPIVQPTIMRNLRAVQLPSHRAKPWEQRFVAMLRAHLQAPRVP